MPGPDEIMGGQGCYAGINLIPCEDIEIPPFNRAVLIVNNELYPSSILGYVDQVDVWKNVNIFVENFFIMRCDPGFIYIILANKSDSNTFELKAGESYGRLGVSRIKTLNDDFFQLLRKNFTYELVRKGFILFLF